MMIRSTCLALGAAVGISLSLALLSAPPAMADAKSPAMQACSEQWAQMKAANKVPAGTTWPKFWSQCSKDYAAAKTAPPAAAPAAGAPAAMEDNVAVPADAAAAAGLNDGKKKRELTAGQQAAIKRIRACGAEWQQTKAAGKLPAGAKWPQFWSDCNKRLKAAGQ